MRRKKRRRRRKKTKPEEEEGSTSSLHSQTRRQSLTWALRPEESTARPPPSPSLTSYSRPCCWLPSAGGRNPHSHPHTYTHTLTQHNTRKHTSSWSTRSHPDSTIEGRQERQIEERNERTTVLSLFSFFHSFFFSFSGRGSARDIAACSLGNHFLNGILRLNHLNHTEDSRLLGLTVADGERMIWSCHVSIV